MILLRLLSKNQALIIGNKLDMILLCTSITILNHNRGSSWTDAEEAMAGVNRSLF